MVLKDVRERTEQGPFSCINPIMLEQPGPPLNQATYTCELQLIPYRRMFSYKWRSFWILACLEVPEPHVHVLSNRHVATMRLDTLCHLADSRIRNVFQLRLGCCVFKDRDVRAIPFHEV